MQPPDRLIRAGVSELPTLGDGRQSGTSGSPSILNLSPESASGGRLGLIRTGDRIRIDLRQRRVDVLLEPEELMRRAQAEGPPPPPPSKTAWEALYRREVTQLSDGAVLEVGLDLRGQAHKKPPRHSH